MALDITGGQPLFWSAGIDTSTLDSDVARVNSKITGITDLFSKIGLSPTPMLQGLIEKFEGLRVKAIDVNGALQKATDPQQITDYTAELKKLTTSLNTTFSQISSLSEGQLGSFPLIKELITANNRVEVLKENLKNLLNAKQQGFRPLFIDKDIEATQRFLKQAEANLDNISEKVKNMPPIVPKSQTPVIDETDVLEKNISAYTRLRQIKNELAEMTLAGNRGTQEFADLSREAEHLNDVIKNTNKELAHSDIKGIHALHQGVRALVGGFEAVNGAIAIFGGESKEAEAATRAVIGAMGVLNGIQEVAAILSKNSALNFYLQGQMQKFSAVASTQQAVATQAVVVAQGEQAVTAGTATAAQRGLNAAMSANPAGILLVAIAALTTALIYFAKSEKTSAELAAELNEKLLELSATAEKLRQIDTGVIDNTLRPLENQLNILKAQGASQQEILKAEIEIGKKRFENSKIPFGSLGVKEFEKELPGLRNKIIELTGKLSTTTTEAGKKALNNSIQLATQDYDRVFTQVKNFYDSKNNLEVKSAQLTTQISEDQKKANDEAEDKAEENSKKARERIIQRLEDEKSAIQVKLNNAKEGSSEELALLIERINKSAEIEAAQEKVTQAKRKEIKSNAAKEISELTLKFANENNKAEIEARIANIQGLLAAVVFGSKEELDLHKQLLDEKASLDSISIDKRRGNDSFYAAKSVEIYAKANQEKLKLDRDFYDKKMQLALDAIDAATKDELQSSQAIIDNPFTGDDQKNQEKLRQFRIEFEAANKQVALINRAILNNQGSIDKLNVQLAAAELRAKNASTGIVNVVATDRLNKLTIFAKNINILGDAFTKLSSDTKGLNSDLGVIFETIGQITNATANAITSFKAFEKAQKDLQDAKDRNNATDQFSAIASEVSAALGIAGAVIGVASFVSGIFKKAAEERRKAKEAADKFLVGVLTGEVEVNRLYRERLLLVAQTNKLKLEGLKAEAVALAKNKQSNIDDFNKIFELIKKEKFHTGIFNAFGTDLQSLAGKSFDDLERLFNTGQLTDKAKELFQTLAKLRDEGLDIKKAEEELKNNLQQTLTGTTSDSIVDSIADGFSQGFKSVQDFAGKTEDIIRGAMLNALKYQALQKPIQALFEQFAADAESGGGLDLTEVANFTASINKTITDAQKFAEQIQKATGINLSNVNASGNVNGISGTIKREITEQTGTALMGSINGMRLTQRDMLNRMNDQINVLSRIESNTAVLHRIYQLQSNVANGTQKWWVH